MHWKGRIGSGVWRWVLTQGMPPGQDGPVGGCKGGSPREQKRPVLTFHAGLPREQPLLRHLTPRGRRLPSPWLGYCYGLDGAWGRVFAAVSREREDFFFFPADWWKARSFCRPAPPRPHGRGCGCGWPPPCPLRSGWKKALSPAIPFADESAGQARPALGPGRRRWLKKGEGWRLAGTSGGSYCGWRPCCFCWD